MTGFAGRSSHLHTAERAFVTSTTNASSTAPGSFSPANGQRPGATEDVKVVIGAVDVTPRIEMLPGSVSGAPPHQLALFAADALLLSSTTLLGSGSWL